MNKLMGLGWGVIFSSAAIAVDMPRDMQRDLPSVQQLKNLQEIMLQIEQGKLLVPELVLDKQQLQQMDNGKLLQALAGDLVTPELQGQFEQFFNGCPACRDIVIATGFRPRAGTTVNLDALCQLQCGKICGGESNP
ncbi:hypothetical protein [Shewanella sp. GXUN23E]|uniref:hypothetical protein n=1 Tax=Shewanella sp. GXUN23E TaxID=3422498 RepID=UPI003D7E7342